jgi:hypothetical protein
MDPAINLEDSEALTACANLVERTGALEFKIGFLRDDPTDPQWYAYAQYPGNRRIAVENFLNPIVACDELARRLLMGGQCQTCDRLITVDPTIAIARDAVLATTGQPWSMADQLAAGVCFWQRTGKRWISGCEKPTT